ncbi:ATP-grasp peptide maturase system methyltransferase [Streptomyces sp. NPDC002306]
MTSDTAPARRALADRLTKADILTPAWRPAVEAVPRELFLHPGVFLPTDDGRWQPVTALATDPGEWTRIAYQEESLVTQLDGHLTADQTATPVAGIPTSSSTTPTTVVAMLEHLDLDDGHSVLEIGTGTGYSTALLCHRLGEDNITTVEVDPDVAARADAALEACGYSTWTVTGDGLLGHPHRAPYDRVIATCAVRRIPYTWVRQTKPGGIILSTVGSWPYGTGLAKVTVHQDGTAHGQIIGRSSFMQARSQAAPAQDIDLSARTAYTDSHRPTRIPPTLLDEWMPAFLTQLTAPTARLLHVATGGTRSIYLLDDERESFATFTQQGTDWTVRQGGPIALWDTIENTLAAWQNSGTPGISSVHLHITDRSHTYWIDGEHELQWEHHVA